MSWYLSEHTETKINNSIDHLAVYFRKIQRWTTWSPKHPTPCAPCLDFSIAFCDPRVSRGVLRLHARHHHRRHRTVQGSSGSSPLRSRRGGLRGSSRIRKCLRGGGWNPDTYLRARRDGEGLVLPARAITVSLNIKYFLFNINIWMFIIFRDIVPCVCGRGWMGFGFSAVEEPQGVS